MALSIHRLVQQAVLDRLSSEQKVYYLDNVINMLFHDFPNTWNGTDASQGHGYKSWAQCGAVLSHVSWIMALTTQHELEPSNPDMWAELIFRSGTSVSPSMPWTHESVQDLAFSTLPGSKYELTIW